VAGLNISEPVQNRYRHRTFIAFVDINTSSFFDMCNQDMIMNKIKSKKDYRKLRRLVRLKLIDAIRQIQDLAEDSLRNLGARI
ncbi:MAG: hypothetical protein V3T88_02900, partial [Nitrosomonadaceae bacterium]